MNRLLPLMLVALLAGCASYPLRDVRAGMTRADVEAVVGEPLRYVGGGPRDEVFMARRRVRPSVGDSIDEDISFKFHNGRLTAWKTDQHLCSLRAGCPEDLPYR